MNLRKVHSFSQKNNHKIYMMYYQNDLNDHEINWEKLYNTNQLICFNQNMLEPDLIKSNTNFYIVINNNQINCYFGTLYAIKEIMNKFIFKIYFGKFNKIINCTVLY